MEQLTQDERNLIHIQRTKMRRVMETKFRKLNKTFNRNFIFKYTSHFVERLLQRDVELDYIIEVLSKLATPEKTSEMMEFIKLPATERAMRLELTDGVLWIGTTMDCYGSSSGIPVFKLRMAVINDKRYPGSIPKSVIRLDGINA